MNDLKKKLKIDFYLEVLFALLAVSGVILPFFIKEWWGHLPATIFCAVFAFALIVHAILDIKRIKRL